MFVNFAITLTRLTADVGFVAFHDSLQLRGGWQVWRHRKTNTVHQEQSRFVADLTVTLNLQSRNAFL